MIGSVYDYYLTTYASKPATKSDTHKKSELRNVYNNIVNISKKSPLYKINVSADMQKYVIDLKENARFLLDDINNLVFDTSSVHNYKYTSDNEDIISVTSLIPSETTANESLVEDYNIKVESLATPQVNTGNYLRDDSLNFTLGEHAFEVEINNTTYELQFNVNKSDTNSTILEKISRLVNHSDIGLHANVLHLGGNSTLEISSTSTGTTANPTTFKISESYRDTINDTIGVLGIDNITSYPKNAKFTLNGLEKTSVGNTFTINKSLEITLKSVTSDGTEAKISRKNNLDSIIDSIKELVSGYNNIVDISKSKVNDNGDAAKLNKEMRITALRHKNELESVGLSLKEDGLLEFDEAIILQASQENSLNETLDNLTSFKNGLEKKLSDITINPMKYVNKIMISYPHPSKAFANPYVTSIYSGMMYNGYI